MSAEQERLVRIEALPEAPATITTGDWVETITTRSHLRMQEKIVTFCFGRMAVSLAATTLIFFLQGFHALGFALDLNILGGLAERRSARSVACCCSPFASSSRECGSSFGLFLLPDYV